MDRFSEIRAFVTVAEQGSFAAAADRLDLSRAMVTKLVSALEARLGVRLMHRTTRRLSLTEAGETYLAQGGALLAELEDLDALLSQGASKASGRLRVTAPVSFGMRFLGRAIAGFQRQHPQVEVELSLNDRKVDLVDEGFDLAIRVSNLDDSSLIARPLAKVRDRLCASPDYLLRHGVPQHPDELAQHDCLIYTLINQPHLWEYQGPDGQPGKVRIKGSLRANNGDILTDAAVHGMGITRQPEFLLQQALESGQLQTILDDYRWSCLDVSAVYPIRRHVPGKVRVFVDFLVDFFAQQKNSPSYDGP
ncbi:LysR family transcriptional regulator [Aquitalea sp. USM4]|uniref:LysR family transcriptional regulator n=1 Tax=Aquitalea sp. USM4 TaxID=1590041 RepID=UPI00103B0A5E|nr:LysR family transcriptional regulator [Aquitalea sp. USM4]QBJ78449.1 LysR family transcriptional regulator [Aquitalea sp. USM4]